MTGAVNIFLLRSFGIFLLIWLQPEGGDQGLAAPVFISQHQRLWCLPHLSSYLWGKRNNSLHVQMEKLRTGKARCVYQILQRITGVQTPPQYMGLYKPTIKCMKCFDICKNHSAEAPNNLLVCIFTPNLQIRKLRFREL